MKWHFSRKLPSDVTRDPIAGEFFASDAIKDAGEALVREGIQNSLDARLNVTDVCCIRIFLSAERGAIDAQRHSRWFESAWPHYMAPKNGLKSGSISPEKKCRYLVFEDFETTGLTGSTEQYDPIDGQKNAFFYFFRAEGKTEKEGDDRGRWGIGKQVFPRSSRAQTFFGYSETADGPALMGRCILKHHHIDSGACFKPDGYFGVQKSISNDIFTVPIQDAEIISQFKNDFQLSRKSGQTGLSIVVPWLDDGDEEDPGNQGFGRNAISIAAISGYFIPIMEGRLEVIVEDHIGSYRINSETYQGVLGQIESSGDKKLKDEVKRFRAYLEVAEIAKSGAFRDFALPACNSMKAEWTAEMLPEAQAQEMREALSAGETIRVKSTLTVRPKEGSPIEDSFFCLVRKVDDFSAKPCHVREDLIISEVARWPINGFVCLIRVNRGPLATLLGDSENPSHTEWQKDSKNFKGKYTYGGVAIEFVSLFAHSLVRRIHATSRHLDRKLLANLFYDELPEAEQAPTKPKPQSAKETDKPFMPPVIGRSEIRITETRNGFSVFPAGPPFRLGARINLKVAYETSKGNPFKAYKIFDFNLEDDVITKKQDGCEISVSSGNNMVIIVKDSKFSLHVSGFDINRDLVVKAKLEEEGDQNIDSPDTATI